MYGPQVAPLPRLLPPLDDDGWQGPAGGDRLPDRQPARPQQGGGGRAAAIPDQPDQDNPAVLIRPSSVEQRRKSLRYLAQGDEQFHRHDYLASVGKYRQATQAARDLAEPRLKLGMALATIAEYQQAVSHLKFGLRLDPNWPDHGESLDELFGEGHDLAKNSILRNIGRWVEEDIRDPDRLFLFGVFLYFNNDFDSARRVLETAAAITHGADHVRAFLTEQPQRVQAPPQPGIGPQVAEAQPAGPRGQHPRPRGGRDEQTGRNRPPAVDDAPVPHPPEEPDEGRSAGERR
ncbi:MAG: hypothetical protein EHM42_09405 [Planctomycetaceae bacterium]|nr:MAG: hypothetical protein EHM42_09405 [Planctomycetaceae bacterium]